MSFQTLHGTARAEPSDFKKSPAVRFVVRLRQGVLMTATPVRRWTEVAIAGFKTVHSFEALSVTIEQTVKPPFWRSRIVSARASAIVAYLVTFTNQAPAA
jgi:hypothetical protein